MMRTVLNQLAIDMNCAADDFLGEGFVFREAVELPGRRPFPRGESHFEMATVGRAVVVCASPELLPWLEIQLKGKSRDEAFSMPFICGHSLYYLPDPALSNRIDLPDGYEYELLGREAIPPLYELEGFRNALGYDVNHPRPDVLAALAIKDGAVVGMAGASIDCERLWQVGIDVLPAERGHGLAAALVQWLTREILQRGYVPYYGTASSNIASQRVAHRAGYAPAWMCSYQARFDEMMKGE